MLSNILCADPLTSNVNKIILVSREATLYSFSGSYFGHLLTHCVASLPQGVVCAEAIAGTIGQKVIQSDTHAEIVKEILKKM